MNDNYNDRIVASALGPLSVHVGRGTYWHSNNQFYTYINEEKIFIGRYCSIAQEAVISTGGGHFTDLVTTWPLDHFLLGKGNPNRCYKTSEDTRIGSDVWIGFRAQVLSGCQIGHGAVIGAGAVVSKDVPPYAIVVGNPGQIIRYRFSPDICEALLRIEWWNWTTDQMFNRAEWFFKPVEEFVAEFDRPLKAPS